MGNMSSGFGKDCPRTPKVSAAWGALSFDLSVLSYVMALTLRGRAEAPEHSSVLCKGTGCQRVEVQGNSVDV